LKAEYDYPAGYKLQAGDRVRRKGWAGRVPHLGAARFHEACIWRPDDTSEGMHTLQYRIPADGYLEKAVPETELTIVPKVRFFRKHNKMPFGSSQQHPVVMAILSVSPTDPSTYQNPQYRIFRPGTGSNSGPKRLEDLLHRYQRKNSDIWVESEYVEITEAEATPLWRNQYKELLGNCIHGPHGACGGFPSCTVGSRAREMGMLCGTILPVWGAIKPVFERFRPTRDQDEAFIDDGEGHKEVAVKVPLARVQYQEAGQVHRLVGVKLDDEEVQEAVCQAIKNFQQQKNDVDPYDLPNSMGSHYMGLEVDSEDEAGPSNMRTNATARKSTGGYVPDGPLGKGGYGKGRKGGVKKEKKIQKRKRTKLTARKSTGGHKPSWIASMQAGEGGGGAPSLQVQTHPSSLAGPSSGRLSSLHRPPGMQAAASGKGGGPSLHRQGYVGMHQAPGMQATLSSSVSATPKEIRTICLG